MGPSGSVFEGKTLDEAVRKGLESLGLSRAEAMISVIEEGSGGFLGFGSRPYKVRVMPRPGGAIREPEYRQDDDRGRSRGRGRERGGRDRGGRGGRGEREGRGPRGGREGGVGRGERVGRDERRPPMAASGERRGRGDERRRPDDRPRGEERVGSEDRGRREERGRGEDRGRGPDRSREAREDRPREDRMHEAPRPVSNGHDAHAEPPAIEMEARGGEEIGERGDREGGGRRRRRRGRRGDSGRGERGDRGMPMERGEGHGEERGPAVMAPRATDAGGADVVAAPGTPALSNDALAAEGKRWTEQLLTAMGFEATVRASAEGDRVNVSAAVASDEKLLTGEKGEVRQALQQLLNRMINRGETSRYHLQLEINDFWEKRENELRGLAQRLAEEALSRNGEVITDYLNAQERRIIHVTLREDSRVKTYALGTGHIKRLAVAPAGHEGGGEEVED